MKNVLKTTLVILVSGVLLSYFAIKLNIIPSTASDVVIEWCEKAKDTVVERYTEAVDTVVGWYDGLFGGDGVDLLDTSNYILLSTLTSTPLFDEDFDLLVPNTTNIPSNEQVSNVYGELKADAVVATLPNMDLLVLDYGIEVSDEFDIFEFRELIVTMLKNNNSEIEFNTDNYAKNGKVEIPIVEFSTEYNNKVTYSFIGLVNANGKIVTVVLNSSDPYIHSNNQFHTLLTNMVLK